MNNNATNAFHNTNTNDQALCSGAERATAFQKIQKGRQGAHTRHVENKNNKNNFHRLHDEDERYGGGHAEPRGSFAGGSGGYKGGGGFTQSSGGCTDDGGHVLEQGEQGAASQARRADSSDMPSSIKADAPVLSPGPSP
eukprot:CAMPEP_0179851416 /NCGR_PEP_ID=MMETSP0982-20121206/8238_1 /TAXON_ID=483367 /ORGANISM="non described non described, Strain CCMP 2436" /LENGTH=138 /DNA_ID=CAMNT_0021736933 /DNA_START=104 /DNA_END=520 /DNA_ORIENTATION=+